jgi:leader peptidase (prepilin peptidase)/N-methyltransferase
VASHWLIPALAGPIGLALGSFLNVCIVRLPADQSIISPRSRCPQCETQLRWYDNIPLLSYLLLRGHCRTCNQSISWRYPAVELATAVWFVVSFWPFSHPLPTDFDPITQLALGCIATAALGWFLIGLCVTDWREHILPNDLTYGGMFVGLCIICMQAFFLDSGQDDVVLKHQININSANAGRSTGNVFLTGPEFHIFSHIFAAAAAFLLLYLIPVAYKALRKRDGMGLGDAKLLAMIAAFLGIAPTVVALALGIFLATLYALLLLVPGKGKATTRLPFGSFLAVAGLVAALHGQQIADSYLALFR